MKVLQIGRGRSCELLDVPTPTPQTGEVLMKIDAVTTCPQWDLHLRHDEPMFVGHQFHYPYTPGQPGHEATGTIAAVGRGVAGLAVGDRVSAWRDAGHDRAGCYAQYAIHRVENVIKVPSDLAPEATAPAELAMCVGATFFLLRSMRLVGGTVAINGLGPAGLVAAQMARAEGAVEVIGFDLSAVRREYAVTTGLANGAFDPSDESNGLAARPSPPGIDLGIDCVGAKRSVEWLMDRTRNAVALFGVQREDYTYAPRHYGGLSLIGYPGHSRAAAEYAVRLMEDGKLDLGVLVTHHLPLERYAEGIDLLERQQAIKVCFWPHGVPDEKR